MVLRLRFPNRAWWAQWLLGICFSHSIKSKRPALVRWSFDEKRGGFYRCKDTTFVKQTRNFEDLFFFALNFVE